MGELIDVVGEGLGHTYRGRFENSPKESARAGDARGVVSESDRELLLDRLLVSITWGANLRGLEDWTLDANEDSIDCGKTRAMLDVTPTGSRDVSPTLSETGPPVLEDLDEVSTGCGNDRRCLDGLVGLLGAWEAVELLPRLLRCDSSTGCGRGLRDDGGECGAISYDSAEIQVSLWRSRC